MTRVHLVEPTREGQPGIATRCGRVVQANTLTKHGSRKDAAAMVGVTCHWCRWGRETK